MWEIILPYEDTNTDPPQTPNKGDHKPLTRDSYPEGSCGYHSWGKGLDGLKCSQINREAYDDND
jgi:hypothetical protein